MPAEREWRFVMPSPERPVEGGRLGIAQQERDLGD